MECLPQNCVPYRDTKAKQLREERFSYQHPLHDVYHEYCHDMPEIEKKRMSKFGERRFKHFFGMGKVLVVTSNDKVSPYTIIHIQLGTIIHILLGNIQWVHETVNNIIFLYL